MRRKQLKTSEFQKIIEIKNYLEEVVLLNLYIIPELIESYSAILTTSDFSQPSYAKVYSDALKVYKETGEPPVLFLLPEARDIFESKSQNVNYQDIDKESYLTLKQLNFLVDFIYKLVKLVNTSEKLLQPVDVLVELYGELEKILLKIRENKQQYKLSDLITEFLAIIKNRDNVIETGYKEIDYQVQGGLVPGDLVLIGARPRMGKTTFACQIAYKIAKRGKRVNFYSLELDKYQILTKLVAFAKNAQISAIRFFNEDEITQAINSVDKQLYIIDDIFDEKDIITHLKTTRPDVAVIDYLQLVRVNEWDITRDRALTLLTEDLKRVAKKYQVAIVGLSQLKRRAEETSDLYPKLSDLRESGGLEATADIVIMIDRPELRGIDRDEEGNSTKEMGYFAIVKNRRGMEHRFKYKVINSFFYPLEENREEPIQEDFPF